MNVVKELGSISGNVKENEDDEIISLESVTITLEDASGALIAITVTDGEGRYVSFVLVASDTLSGTKHVQYKTTHRLWLNLLLEQMMKREAILSILFTAATGTLTSTIGKTIGMKADIKIAYK